MNDFLRKYQIKRETGVYHLGIIFLLITTVALSYFLASLLIPFVFALFIAYLLNPFVSWLESKGVPQFLAVIVPVMSVIGFLLLIFFIFYSSITSFIEDTARMNWYSQKFTAIYADLKTELVRMKIVDVKKGLSIMEQLFAYGKTYALSLVSSTTSFLSSFILFVLYLLFLLPGLKNFSVKINRGYKKLTAQKINRIHNKILQQLQTYIKAKIIVSLLSGFIVFFISLFFGLDFPIIWGVLAFIMNFIPNFGSIISSVLPLSIAIVQFDSIGMAIFFGLSLIVSLSTIGNYVEPKLLARTLSLSPLVVFVSLMFWGWLWGIVGVILAVPIMSALSIVCQNIKALRPIAVFMQSSDFVREDMEKLSLTYYLISSDDKRAVEEDELLQEELKKEIYNRSSILNSWKKVEKNPLPLEEIFSDKTAEEKIDLYRIACKVAIVDDDLSESENEILLAIQSELVAGLSAEAVDNVNLLMQLRMGNEASLKLPKCGNSFVDKEQVAYSAMLLGRLYAENESKEKAVFFFNRALYYYLQLDEQDKIVECSHSLFIMEV